MNTRTKVQRRTRLSLLGFGVFCWLLPILFISLHVVTPSDGARLSRSGELFSEVGVLLSPYAGTHTLIQEGDVLTAVNGIHLHARAESFFYPQRYPGKLGIDDQPVYTILRNDRQIHLKIALGPLPWQAILSEHWGVLLFFIVSQAVVLFVWLKRPDDPTAQAFFIWGMSGSHTYSWAFFLQASDLLDGTGFWLFHLSASRLWVVFWAATLHMALVFPKNMVRLIRPSLVFRMLYASAFLVFGVYLGFLWFINDEIFLWWAGWGSGQTLLAALYTVPAMVAIIAQYFTSRSHADRIKSRWVIFGSLISLSLGLVLYFLPDLFLDRPFISPNGLGVINFPFIIAIAIAIFRYQLFDIDLIIRRTLQYAILTGLLALVYFGGITLLQGVFTAVSGQQSPIATVLSTLAIAALFTPLRTRIQSFIDRRFYRNKYNAEQALANFSAVARDEVDMSSLTASLAGVVEKTIQPEQFSLWLIKKGA